MAKLSALDKFKLNLANHPMLTVVLVLVAGIAIGRIWGALA